MKKLMIVLLISFLQLGVQAQRNFDSPNPKDEYLELTKIIEQYPDSAELYYERSDKLSLFLVTYPRQTVLDKTYDDVFKDITTAINIDSTKAKYFDRRAIFFRFLKEDIESGLKDLTKAIELEPNNGEWYNNRAVFFYSKGDKTEACNDWKKGAEVGNLPCKRALLSFCRK